MADSILRKNTVWTPSNILRLQGKPCLEKEHNPLLPQCHTKPLSCVPNGSGLLSSHKLAITQTWSSPSHDSTTELWSFSVMQQGSCCCYLVSFSLLSQTVALLWLHIKLAEDNQQLTLFQLNTKRVQRYFLPLQPPSTSSGAGRVSVSDQGLTKGSVGEGDLEIQKHLEIHSDLRPENQCQWNRCSIFLEASTCLQFSSNIWTLLHFINSLQSQTHTEHMIGNTSNVCISTDQCFFNKHSTVLEQIRFLHNFNYTTLRF